MNDIVKEYKAYIDDPFAFVEFGDEYFFKTRLEQGGSYVPARIYFTSTEGPHIEKNGDAVSWDEQKLDDSWMFFKQVSKQEYLYTKALYEWETGNSSNFKEESK